MKASLHPVYISSKVTCACGNNFETRSTKDVIKIEICSACHPFYTGQQRLIDTAGRVERFQKRFKTTEGKTIERKPVKSGMVKLATIAPRRKVLTTAPTKEVKEPKKPAKK